MIVQRLDNCQNIKVNNNTFFSYSGSNNHGSYEHGENGIQVGNQGVSFGVGSPKPDSTEDIEVCDNTFADNGLQAVLLDSAEASNVYVHDNKFVDVVGINTSGISVNGTFPSKELSEKVFSSIFDILNQDFSFSYLNTQTAINASVDVSYYNNSYNPHALVFVDGAGLSGVKYEYNGLTTTHYYKPVDLWSGDIPNEANCLYIQGQFDKSKLQVTCFTPSGYCKITDFNVTEINDNSNQILNPNLWAFVGTLTILGIFIYRNFRRVITSW